MFSSPMKKIGGDEGDRILMNPRPEILQILIAEDDDSFREMIHDFLKSASRTIFSFKNGEEAIKAIGRSSFDLVISDLMMPGADGMKVLREAKGRNPDTVVILITGYASLDSALQAIRGGAYDYIRKPFKLDELEIVVNNACEKVSLVRENKALLSKLKQIMDEMKQPGNSQEIEMPSWPEFPESILDEKISEMDLILSQMNPPNYEVLKTESREKTFQELEKIIQLRKEGFIDALEFSRLKKMLLLP